MSLGKPHKRKQCLFFLIVITISTQKIDDFSSLSIIDLLSAFVNVSLSKVNHPKIILTRNKEKF